MTINFIHPGDVLKMIAPVGGTVSSEGYLIGAQFVIASAGPAAVGEEFTGHRTGVFGMTKKSAEVWADGAQIFWDDTVKEATNIGPADAYIGICEGGALTADVTGRVALNGTGQAAPTTAADVTAFRSPLRVGTGVQELIAHLLGVVPATNGVTVTLYSGHDGAGAIGTQAARSIEGAHDATNLDVIVTDGAEYKVTALA